MSKIVEYIIVADIFVRSKSGFSVLDVELVVLDRDWPAAAGVELGESVIVFLLQESKALGIVASTPQARMAEEYRAKARRHRRCRNAQNNLNFICFYYLLF